MVEALEERGAGRIARRKDKMHFFRRGGRRGKHTRTLTTSDFRASYLPCFIVIVGKRMITRFLLVFLLVFLFFYEIFVRGILPSIFVSFVYPIFCFVLF